MHHTPKAHLRNIFAAKDKRDAQEELDRFIERHQKLAPQLARWAEENMPKGFSVYQLPVEHRTILRTTNMLER